MLGPGLVFSAERADLPARGDEDAHGGTRRDGYMKIKGKSKHLQKLKLNIFPVKIKHSLDKKFSKFDKKSKTFL